jgi:uncharacterized protein (DUF2062 family)
VNPGGGRRGPFSLRQRFGDLVRRLRGGQLSRGRATASVAVGLFIGCLPLYGLHFVLCLVVCLPLRLDLIVAYLAANISNPLIAPLLVVLEVEAGALILTGHTVAFDLERARETGISGFAEQAAVGSLVVGAAIAALGALVTSLVVRPGATEQELQRAIRRAVARYRSVPIGDRIYVAIKLRTDPLTSQLARLPIHWGSVLDVGCGRAQFGILLHELGRAEHVSGFDWDERKIAAARLAAPVTAEFAVGDARAATLPRADTILVLDVLHYLTIEEQSALLGRLAAHVAPGGHLLIRDVDARATSRSRLTRWFERVATRIGYNRGASLHFRTADELVAELTAQGLSCSLDRERASGPLANVLVIARRDGGPQPPGRHSERTSTLTDP